MAGTTTPPPAKPAAQQAQPTGFERVFLGYGPKNQYVINGKIHVGGYADMPNTTPAEQHRLDDLKYRIARNQIGRHEDDVVGGYDQTGEVPDMSYNDFIKANRLQKLDHDRALAQAAKLAQAMGQPTADAVVDAANAHIDAVFAQKAKAEQLRIEGVMVQNAETQQKVADLAAAVVSGAVREA